MNEQIKRWTQLLIGFVLIGAGIAIMVQCNIGLGPWDIFHQGLSYQLPLTIGQISQAVGLCILAILVLAKIRVGWGTITNIIIIGLVTDVVLRWVPLIPLLPLEILTFGLGVVMCGLGAGMYIGAQLGAGPRDSVMLWLSQRTGWSVGRIRTLLEVVVMLIGWLLGGQIGLGTLIFAFGIGPIVQWSLRVFSRPQPEPLPSTL